jgi:hypothetical protein
MRRERNCYYDKQTLLWSYDTEILCNSKILLGISGYKAFVVNTIPQNH